MKNKNLFYDQVYLVDDNKIVNMVNEQIIKRSSITEQINIFTNPIKALEALKREQLISNSNILVLLDINMPEMSGFEFLEKLSELVVSRNNFDLIMVTSSIDNDDRKRATGHPLVCGYVAKPLTIDDIRNFVSTPSLISA